jgi:hypothetical protein
MLGAPGPQFWIFMRIDLHIVDLHVLPAVGVTFPCSAVAKP